MMTEHKNNKKRYASTRSPLIRAILEENFVFPGEEKAIDRLEALRVQYILSRQHPQEAESKSLTLWIRGYATMPEEEKKGFIGHFALVHIKSLEDGKYTLSARKIESDLKFHPQRKRCPQRHPNWGHPVLRNVKKGKIYRTIEAAQEEIRVLHEEFPETSIPLTNKLYLMIYSRAEEGRAPVQKFVLEIKVAGDSGGFIITCENNTFEGTKLPPRQMEDETPEKESPQGYFTSMVELKRSRKKAKPGPMPEKKDEQES